ncbi:transcriptional regulator, TetR family [Methylobacterium sp. ap11]|uniref:TetR/AcrR family transcriptional regulator n=1 Tax=Methylobacterium sp. ap11 TaxID=1761799 RepID=UPI0008BAD606|nr:TetR/AcrR family transcriptional regulator [Methylobacterium sp. ap11]SEP29608.1 transcriptional regulator, TetR family [Methylobacterium sp. ap11]
MPSTPKVRAPLARTGMRDKIKKVATELLIKHGFHGMSFRDVAERCDITTTNIHYHFGSKQQLVEEIVADYVEETGARHRAIWLDENRLLPDKLRSVVAYNHERYRRFNRGKVSGRPWSLIGRLRLDSDVLSPAARASLASFTVTVHAAIDQAFAHAAATGELAKDAPREDLALLVVNLVNSSSVFTQDAGSFERLEQFFGAFERVMLDLYLVKPTAPNAPRSFQASAPAPTAPT